MGDMRVIARTDDTDAFMTLRSDGTAVGMVHNKQDHGLSELAGQWTLDATGRRCTVIRQCGYTYRLGKETFFARSDVDRNATVIAYTGPAFLQ